MNKTFRILVVGALSLVGISAALAGSGQPPMTVR